MRIAYLGKFTHLWDEESIARGLENAGAEVLRIEDSSSLSEVESAVTKFKPHIFLGAKYRIDGAWELLKWLKRRNIISASWTFDLLLGHPPRETIIRNFTFLECDLVFLTDGGHEKEYKEFGIDRVTLRQGIPEEFYYMEEPQDGTDIVFVGTANPTFPYRQETMKFLTRTYDSRFEWIGNGKQTRGDDLNKLYASAKIVIGDSMYSPNYWSNRIYETLGRGGFLIHPMIEGLEKEYIPYKEFIPYTWGDYKGLHEKIEYFLKRPEERRAIQEAAFKKTKKYTVNKRCKVLYKHFEKALD